MEKRMRKKITAIILTFALAISLMPSMTLSAMAEASGSWSDAANMSEPAYNSGTHTYTITSSAELAWFANAVNTGNIPMDSNATVSAPGGIDLSAHTWVPIGNGHDYTGTFDGGSCTITGLTISSVLDSGSQNNIGLFGNISGATISDVALSGVSISLSSGYSEDCVGALAGVANGSSITHCSAAGSITLTCGGQASGGLVGSGDGLSVTDCSSSVEVTSNYRNIGGLAGQVGSLSSISSINRSFATGNVSVLADGFFWLSCGGLIGTLGGTLEKSYATGSVMGSFTCGGGLIGRLLNGSNITNSYETGDVRGTSPNTAGGLVGNMEGGNCSISYAYSAGIAGASSWNGGFIGYYGGDDNTLSDVYYNIANVYCYKNTSSLLSGVIGMTLTDMKTSEFANTLNTLNAGVWSYDSEQNGGYPMLSGVGNTQTFSVLYDGNGSDSGTVPADGGEYADGANVTVLGNTGSLEKAGYTFAGWNTESNGNGTNYIANQTFAMGAADVTLYAKWTAESTGSHHSSSPEPTRNTNATVIIGGESQNAGTIATSSEGGRSITTVTVDDGKLEEILEEKGGNATVTIPVNTGADIVTGILSGQTVKNMESKEAVLEIRTESVTYTLPASEINIDSVSAQIGEQVQLADIEVNVSIAAPPQDTVKIVEDTANINNYQVVVKPVEFEITCTYGNKTVDVSEFNGYVERTVVIPDGIDPSKITTGIVLNANGAFSHVPTTILVIGGKYYAKLNSLTNSVYSVIYNPIEFADVIGHWAKDAVNDMGSRLVVSGIGNGNFGPDNDITRAEFAAIVVRALGLRAGTGENKFSDVKMADWYCGYIETASSYGIINGYTDGSFGPNDKITREQAMAMVERAMKITKLEPGLSDSEISALLDGYSDLSQASDYAKPGIAACLKTGVITGKSSDTVAPKDYITRAEVAVIVRRLLQKSDLI